MRSTYKCSLVFCQIIVIRGFLDRKINTMTCICTYITKESKESKAKAIHQRIVALTNKSWLCVCVSVEVSWWGRSVTFSLTLDLVFFAEMSV
jgi:hypothetical protein